MTIETWLAFIVASSVMLVIPGPVILLVVSYALGQGKRAACPTAVGVVLGDFTAMTLSMLGVGALLATSAALFTALKWLGAACLIWLGLKLWRTESALDAQPRECEASGVEMFAHAWIVTALNPKSITFFVAFVPQFLNLSGDFWTQMVVLEATFLLLAFFNAFGYGLAASRARSIARNDRAVGIFNKVGGTLLISAGLAAATAHRA